MIKKILRECFQNKMQIDPQVQLVIVCVSSPPTAASESCCLQGYRPEPATVTQSKHHQHLGSLCKFAGELLGNVTGSGYSKNFRKALDQRPIDVTRVLDLFTLTYLTELRLRQKLHQEENQVAILRNPPQSVSLSSVGVGSASPSDSQT